MTTRHEGEQPTAAMGGRLNWLRAAVLGANDGIVSTAGIVVGVAGATSARGPIFTAGLAGAVAGAVSMALGEYVSVSSQRDSEKAQLAREEWELANLPEHELEELTAIYVDKGLSPELAQDVARQLTEHDALAAHAEAELGIDPTERTNPFHAAWSSMAAFSVGALLPLLAILLPPPSLRLFVTVLAVTAALVLTGVVSSRLGGAPARPAILRNVGVGLVAMAITFLVGSLFGA
jgi:VIT1/CCC1 family predicted Fe2+/Mn2+ transporter